MEISCIQAVTQMEYRGGTLQTTEVLYCLLRQTERRTQDLIYFGGEK